MPKYNHDHLTGEMPGSHNNQTILMIVFFAVWILDSFVFRFTTFLSSPILLWLHVPLGVIILGVSIYFMNASHKDLFDAHVEGLATEGVYGRVRHPMYLGTFLFYLGLSVATLSLASLAVWIITVAFYNTLANYEEKKLEERFGGEFQDYKKEVRKWIPV
jgi:protein-S-isoprenylcysteine O-methyltransferase Ste14